MKDILKTLSDTELIVVARELRNPAINNLTIYEQLKAKGNVNDGYIDTNDMTNLQSYVLDEMTIRMYNHLQEDK